MTAPDFARARRQLRRARIQDALTMPREVNVALNRDHLLELLAQAADDPVAEFDSLDEDMVDTVVSLALAEVEEERATDSLIVTVLCVRVLAADGHFARLALLADRLRALARRLELDRPFLSAASRAFAFAMQGREPVARRMLEERLGLSEERPQVAVLDGDQLSDVLIAAALRATLREPDAPFVAKAVALAERRGDGLSLAFLEAISSWSDAVSRARPLPVLQAADPSFADERLARYVRRRRIPVLYPPQIHAIASGATLDRDRVVALPTSSGKTLVAEFRVAATLHRHPATRAIYVAPYRLLARQVARSFREGLRELDLVTRDLGTGFDPTIDEFATVLPDIAICTPERLDALLRLASTDSPAGLQAAELFSTCSVLVFDELQLVGRSNRGPRFELIIARLRSRFPRIRILGLCAANQGADALGEWLSGQPAIAGARRPTGTLEIVWETGGTMRQRAANRQTAVASIDRTARPADDAADLILRLDARYRPALAVETSRQQAEGLAKRLVARSPAVAASWREALTARDLSDLNAAIEEVQAMMGVTHPLATYLADGIAFHHAGVPTNALQQIEKLSARGILRVVCATTTVAEGADLPFKVVVIPHLNFSGPSRRLERDLYLNIIGRAGRANVSVEGIVFLLDSDAATLRNLVRGSLWSNTTRDRIRGRLSDVRTSLRTLDDWNGYYDVQSQVLGWLGDGDSYVDDQAEVLSEATLSAHGGDVLERAAVASTLSDALDDLEQRGYALAASPYQLTPRGRSARLTGLSAPTVQRLERAVERGRDGWLLDLVGVDRLDEDAAAQIAAMLLEGIEVAEHSLWLRRSASTEIEKLQAVAEMAEGNSDEFYASSDYEADIDLLTAWILGATYVELAERAPVYSHAGALFGGSDPAKRTSDATEYIGKLTYPGAWVWSGVRVLAGPLGDGIPSFVRRAIELGAPSEAATTLLDRTSMTRGGALAIALLNDHNWTQMAEWITSAGPADHRALRLTTLDVERLSIFAANLGANDDNDDPF